MDSDHQKQQTRLYRNHTRLKDCPLVQFISQEKQRQSDTNSRSKKKMCQLSAKDKIAIVHAVIVESRSNLDVATEFNVKPILVSSLVCRSKKNREFLDELQLKEDAVSAKREVIREKTMAVINTNRYVWKASQITNEVNAGTELRVTDRLVRQVFREDLDLRYRKLKRIAFQGNSERCLVQRQEFAKILMGLMSRNLNIINVDETHLCDYDFRRQKWYFRGTSNSLSVKAISPRINMIIGIDSFGEIFLSLLQVNND
jgi:transposase